MSVMVLDGKFQLMREGFTKLKKKHWLNKTIYARPFSRVQINTLVIYELSKLLNIV